MSQGLIKNYNDLLKCPDYQQIWAKQSSYYFINCGLEESLNGKIPAVVSLVESPCLAVPSNSIRGDLSVLYEGGLWWFLGWVRGHFTKNI